MKTLSISLIILAVAALAACNRSSDVASPAVAADVVQSPAPAMASSDSAMGTSPMMGASSASSPSSMSSAPAN